VKEKKSERKKGIMDQTSWIQITKGAATD